jgi:precorrin-6A synthase
LLLWRDEEDPHHYRHRAGDPGHITMQAVAALNRVDVFFVLEKGAPPRTPWWRCARGAGATPRTALSRCRGRRARRASPGRADYEASVDALNRAKQEVFERLIAQ